MQPYFHHFKSRNRYSSLFAIQLRNCGQQWSQAVSGAPAVETLRDLLESQMDFLNALHSPDEGRSLALRYITHPAEDSISSGRIDVVLLGKVTDRTKRGSTQGAGRFLSELRSVAAGFLPDLEWAVITDEDRFMKLFRPLVNADHLAEIRRREICLDLSLQWPRPQIGSDRKVAAKGRPGPSVYMVHPFRPRIDPLSRVLRALLLTPQPVVWQIALSPTSLTDGETAGLVREISACEAYSNLETRTSGAFGQPHPLQMQRASRTAQLLVDQLEMLQDAPLLCHIMVASSAALPPSLVETIGVQITEPIGATTQGENLSEIRVGGYDVLRPDAGELSTARANLERMEFTHWGAGQAPPDLSRLRQMMDAWQAAGAFRLPYAYRDGLPGLQTRAARVQPMPFEAASIEHSGESCQQIGVNPYLGFEQPAHLLDADRTRHVYIMGQTGTGKTTLLKTMINSDMQTGKGIAVIDPHGDLFEETLASVPRNRIEDVIILDPTDPDNSIGLNLLEARNTEDRYFVAGELCSIIERLMRDQYGVAGGEYTGPRFRENLRMATLLVMSRAVNPDAHPDTNSVWPEEYTQNQSASGPGTLVELYELLTNDEFHRAYLPLEWKTPQLQTWVDNVERILYRPYEGGGTLGDYIGSRIADFVLDPRLRRIFGQKRSTVDFDAIFNDGKILLVNLAKGVLTESNSRFLGMILMARIQAAAMKRTTLPPQRRRPFYLYVDEFQSIATENFSLMLSEARKFGIGLVLANQFLSQIDDKHIRQAVFGNVGTLIGFRMGHEDATLMASHFKPYFSEDDLTNLPNWTACARLTARGQVIPPFTLRTLPPRRPTDGNISDLVWAHARKSYLRHRDEIDEEIRAALGPP